MSGYICRSCRVSMRRTPRLFTSMLRTRSHTSDTLFDENEMRPTGFLANKETRDRQLSDGSQEETIANGSQETQKVSTQRPKIYVEALLSKPTWSVHSLLPEPDVPPEDEITPAKLHHLLRLSALPLPQSPDEETKMIETLHSQLHFVRDIQKVNTDGVEPLRSIRDETEEGIKEITIGMEQLKKAFNNERIVGKNKRPKRVREAIMAKKLEDWNVFRTASEVVKTDGGRYFVVRSGPKREPEKDIPKQSKDDPESAHGEIAVKGEMAALPEEGNSIDAAVPCPA